MFYFDSKIFNNFIDYSVLLERFKINVSGKQLRNFLISYLETYRDSYVNYGSVNRICILANDFYTMIDFFSKNLSKFKLSLIETLIATQI